MRTLLIDNYDSFTHNVFQLLAEVNGEEPLLVRNDELDWERLSRLEFDNVVISPGPGRPQRDADFGVCAEVIRESPQPLLGICLGFQGLCWVHGAEVGRAPEARHGRLSRIRHDGSPLFEGIPLDERVVRYHSLAVLEPLPAALAPLARAEDGVLMAVGHRHRPQWGVQFHPESVCAEHGRRLLENFRRLSEEAATGEGRRLPRRAGAASPGRPPQRPLPEPAPPQLRLRTASAEWSGDPEPAFLDLYGDSDSAFWLDGDGGRFSFLGDASGPLAARISYDLGERQLTIARGEGVERREESIFDYLERELARPWPTAPELPFEFDCGFVGYLGYELKAECGGAAAHASPLPDAQLVFADRLLAFDRAEGRVHLLCLDDGGGTAAAWLSETAGRLCRLAGSEVPPPGPGPAVAEFQLARSPQRYLEEIAECGRLLRDGETYEVCLTNRILTAAEPEPLSLYRRLRRLSPAPYSAYLRFGALALASSSPERFLGVDRDGGVEARPIKGTAPRGADRAEDERLGAELVASEKNRAENLMIADLMRNDLGEVCEVGSIEVPQLIGLETYPHVHQLVSVVRGRLREGVGAVGCVRACFPPGSMTGAPKRRTMAIIDELEGEARGVYSGAVGYFGLGGGCDLSVVIRTIVTGAGETSIGVGGGIVVQSEPHEEYQESLLKGAAPMQAIDPRASLAPAAVLPGNR